MASQNGFSVGSTIMDEGNRAALMQAQADRERQATTQAAWELQQRQALQQRLNAQADDIDASAKGLAGLPSELPAVPGNAGATAVQGPPPDMGGSDIRMARSAIQQAQGQGLPTPGAVPNTTSAGLNPQAVSQARQQLAAQLGGAGAPQAPAPSYISQDPYLQAQQSALQRMAGELYRQGNIGESLKALQSMSDNRDRAIASGVAQRGESYWDQVLGHMGDAATMAGGTPITFTRNPKTGLTEMQYGGETIKLNPGQKLQMAQALHLMSTNPAKANEMLNGIHEGLAKDLQNMNTASTHAGQVNAGIDEARLRQQTELARLAWERQHATMPTHLGSAQATYIDPDTQQKKSIPIIRSMSVTPDGKGGWAQNIQVLGPDGQPLSKKITDAINGYNDPRDTELQVLNSEIAERRKGMATQNPNDPTAFRALDAEHAMRSQQINAKHDLIATKNEIAQLNPVQRSAALSSALDRGVDAGTLQSQGFSPTEIEFAQSQRGAARDKARNAAGNVQPSALPTIPMPPQFMGTGLPGLFNQR
jgi:hypothetical protein